MTPPDWYASTTTYGANVASEVGYYNGSGATSYYPANELTKTTVTTPQSSTKNIETNTWTDKKGRVVLSQRKEAGSSTNVANMYTLYDDKDRVAKILPPGVGTTIGDAGLRFEYLYDDANNLITKKVPDMASVVMKYNNRDQLVLTQDGNLLALGKWALNKYDDYGRPISSGLYTGSSPDPNTALTYSEQHSNTTYGTTGVELGKVKSTLTWAPGLGTFINRTFTYSTVTGRMLTDTGTDNYTYTYDYAGNVLTKVRAHKTSTSSSTLTLTERYTYDRSGRKNTFYHQINSNAEKQVAKYAYDFRDRMIDKSLDSVKVGSVNSYLQNIDYAYNEQNWLTSLNSGSSFSALSQAAVALCASAPAIPNPTEAAFAADPDGNDLFKLDLYYDSPGLTFGSPTGQRNGNISQLVWQVRGRERQGYSLQYDYLDRLTTSYYADITSAGTASTNNKFQENVTYADARGNIGTINRNGNYKTTGSATCFTVGTIDNLTFTYNSGTNRLQKIADAATVTAAKSQGFNPGSASGTATYGYDANGNMTSDPYKAMTLTYNHLNLPITMNFGSTGNIAVLYDYVGKKLRKVVTPGTGTGYTQDYVDGLEYRTNSGGGTLTLEGIYHPEGRITPNGANFQYEYSIQDHLGNARLTFADLNANGIVDVPGDILQENHYYPFGMKMNYTWMDNVALDNRYQYNGKEFNDDLGLNWNDYGARWYDGNVGRFYSLDRFTEKYSFMSTYQYTSNNPLKYIDVNGDSIAIRVDKNNVAIYDKGKVYNSDGSQYTGKGVKIKKDGTMKLTGFLKSTVKALDKIRAGGDVGGKLVSKLETDKNMFVIKKDVKNKTVGRSISFDPSSSTGGPDEKGGNSRPAFVGLAHELAHALDWDDGVVDESPWITFSGGEIATNSEKYATFIENQIRAENNLPLREFYGEDNGKSVGRLLIPKTKASLHQSTMVHGVPVPYIYKK